MQATTHWNNKLTRERKKTTNEELYIQKSYPSKSGQE
jgi:hypothetical protein